MTASLLLTVGLFLSAGGYDGKTHVLSVGFAEADITPKLGTKPVYLAGFGMNRVATKVHDPLLARAVVLHDGHTKIAMVSADLVGLFITSTERIRAKLPGFDYVLVSSTHNHNAPDTMGLWGPNVLASGVDDDYLKSVETTIFDTVLKAEKACTLAKSQPLLGTAKDESLVNDNREPYIKHDEIVVLKFTTGTENKTAGIIVQWNCHPELLGSKSTAVTADHVGSTVKTLQERHKCPVVYFNGTLGGLMTALGLKVKSSTGRELDDGTFEKCERYGELIADLADKALANAKPVSIMPFRIQTTPVLFRVDNGIYQVAWQIGKLNRPLYLWENDPFAKAPVAAKNLDRPVAIRSEVGLLTLGDLGVAVIPGEIYPELTLGQVQNPADPNADYPNAPMEPGVYPNMPQKYKMIIGLGNDELGYFVPKRQWDQLPPHCYSRKKPQYGEINSIGPDAAPTLCDAFLKLCKDASPVKSKAP